MRRVLVLTMVGAALSFGPRLLTAQPFPVRDLPPELAGWVPWVLDDVKDLGCARVQGRAVCLWPGRLQLTLGGSGGSFTLELQADRSVDLRLPGSAEHWPQAVQVDGASAPVFARDEAPHARVERGRHRVTGRFEWSRLPESLAVPAEVGLVDVSLDGQAVPRPRREQGGLLWLRARGAEASEGESLRLQVFRHVEDGIPLFVETRILLEVAGRAREITLPAALLPDTAPVAVWGDLPARVEAGSLRVQVRGGRYAVSVRARVLGQPKGFERQAPAASPNAAWPATEVWVFQAAESLRQVELSGPAPIDPSRTELPEEWRALPAFLMEAGARLNLAERRRGQAAAPPDSLRLTREVWIDPSGGEASVRDRFHGELRATTRLDLLPPGALGRVAVDGQDQLVTKNPVTSAAGVELRRATLQLEADSRLSLRGALPAVGWSTWVEQLQVTVHLPPGFTLLAATGVDNLPGTWTSRFNLLAFFFVLVVALGVHRLFGLRPALLALVTLILIHGEPGAPFLVWLSLLCALALRRVAPEGRIATAARLLFLASAGYLLLLLVPFARDQVTLALFPQVGESSRAAERGVVGGRAGAVAGAVPMALPAKRPRALGTPPPPATVPAEMDTLALAPQQGAMSSSEQVEVEAETPEVSLSKSASVSYSYNQALEQDPKAVLQTGPGVPTWSWRTHALRWSGPVSREHRMRLFLASPGQNRLLTVVRLTLLGALTFLLLAGRLPSGRRPSSPAAGDVAVPVAILLAALLTGGVARADEPRNGTPGREVLEELKRRLTRHAPCEPRCVSTPSLVLRLDAARLAIAAEVHAAADGTWAVPGPLASWSAADLRVDGVPAVAVAHLGDGFLHIRLAKGVHRIEAAGPVPSGDSFTLQFADPPRRARAEAPLWDVSGLRRDGPAEPSILLTRRVTAKSGTAGAEGRYAPWLEVTRTLGFGIRWTVDTHVRRLTPRGAPVAVRIPLLPGEAPTRTGLVVENGEAAVSLGGDEDETSFESTLEQAAKLTLRAPEGKPWSEVWRLACSAIWPCKAEGLSPITRLTDGIFSSEYRPWPGETLVVTLQHPGGVDGQTLTLDAVRLEANPGSRLVRARLEIQARSSREQPLVLGLPADAEVQSVKIDGVERPSGPQAGELRVTLPAGAHGLEVRWQQPRGMSVFYAAPRVRLSSPAVNVTQQITVPPERFLVVTRGPFWGPAVLFWPYLLFLLGVAYVLGRLPQSPLTSVQWLLLGLGLSQIPATGALVVAAFVFGLGLRARHPPKGALAFDAVQMLLVATGLVSVGLLYSAIQQGLLFRPDLQVAGNGSTDLVLRWYADRVAEATPAASVMSLPMGVYRVAMLLWALWLAASLVRAFGWGWRALSEGGLWRPLVPRPAKERPSGEGIQP